MTTSAKVSSLPSRRPATMESPVSGMKRTTLSLLALLGFLQVVPAQAESWYDLEVLVFLRNPDRVSTIEHYTPAQLLVVPNRHWTLSGAGLVAGIDASSPSDELKRTPVARLSTAEKRLSGNRNYQVLYSAAWKQALPDRGSDLPVLIQALPKAPGIHQLEGKLTFTNGQTVQVAAELSYFEYAPAPENPLETASVSPDEIVRVSSDGATHWRVEKSFRMRGQRNMRLDEVNYLDHPQLGLLIYAKPAENQSAGTAEAASEEPSALQPELSSEPMTDSEELTD